MCKFWWQTNSKKEKGIHWQSWNSMCKRKSAGWMGFRSVCDFNIGLLGNLGRRLLKYPENLVSKVYKAHYYPQGSFLNVKIDNNPTYTWRSVLESQAIIKKGVGCIVENGKSMKDPWLPDISEAYIQTSNAC